MVLLPSHLRIIYEYYKETPPSLQVESPPKRTLFIRLSSTGISIDVDLIKTDTKLAYST
jgi:hypothetical protein